jgi:hypothetical protein
MIDCVLGGVLKVHIGEAAEMVDTNGGNFVLLPEEESFVLSFEARENGVDFKKNPSFCPLKPGSGDSSWLTNSHLPGLVTVLILLSCALVRHGFLVARP